MDATPAPGSFSPRRLLYSAGAVLLLVIHVFLNPPREPSGSAAWIGEIVGALLGVLMVVAIVYVPVRLSFRGRPAPSLPAVAFWTLLVLAVLQLLSAVGKVMGV